MNEMLKIIDKNRNPIGVKPRDKVHRDGDWHETFQCWFVERVENSFYIYLQKRSASKKDFPQMFDITAAGHLLMDETVEDGVREIKEELGIELHFDDLTFLAAIPNSIITPNFLDNEISLVYLYEVNEKKKCEFNYMDQEVESIFRVPLDRFEALVLGDINQTEVEIYSELKKRFISFDQSIHKTQVVPHSEVYYLTVLEKIKEVISKR